MRRLYSLLIFLALPIVFLRLFLKGRKNSMYRQRWKERLGIVPKQKKDNDNQKIIWIHAVSVGEVEATVPLVKKLFAEFPDLKIIMTTTTPTGAETVKRRYADEYDDRVVHYYASYDVVYFLQRFIDRIKPELLIIMETEVWPNMIYICQKNKLPVILANARMSANSAKGYQRISKLSVPMFSGLSVIAAQTGLDAQRIISLGIEPDRVAVTGSLKFDQHLPEGIEQRSAKLKKQIGSQRPVWIAASTHPGEEDQILIAHRQILKILPDCLLILVPRHPERFEEVFKRCEEYSVNTSRRSLNETIDGQVYLVDTMGDLMLCYGAADVAFVAGSLTSIGGHNLLEPASLGLPVLMGPYTFKIEKIFQIFLDADAAFRINNAIELEQKVLYLLEHDQERVEYGNNARKLVKKNQGAAGRHLELIKKLELA